MAGWFLVSITHVVRELGPLIAWDVLSASPESLSFDRLMYSFVWTGSTGIPLGITVLGARRRWTWLGCWLAATVGTASVVLPLCRWQGAHVDALVAPIACSALVPLAFALSQNQQSPGCPPGASPLG